VPRFLRTKRPAPAQRGIGAFERTQTVQDPNSAIATGLKDSISDQPGLRLAGGGGRRVYFGGALTPQSFTRPPADTNGPDSLRAAILHVNAPRSTSKTRGRIAQVALQTGDV